MSGILFFIFASCEPLMKVPFLNLVPTGSTSNSEQISFSSLGLNLLSLCFLAKEHKC